VEIPFLEHRGEPLALELGEFVHAVAGRHAPRVPGVHGRNALVLAHRILESAANFRP
jgi:predicted dehydrogenase